MAKTATPKLATGASILNPGPDEELQEGDRCFPRKHDSTETGKAMLAAR
jgi:hypothetical protein